MRFNWAFKGLMYRVIQEETSIFWRMIVSVGERSSTNRKFAGSIPDGVIGIFQ